MTYSIRSLQQGLRSSRILPSIPRYLDFCRQDHSRIEAERERFPKEAHRAEQGPTEATGEVRSKARPGLLAQTTKTAPQAFLPARL